MSQDKNILLELYKKIILCRLFEERVLKLILEGFVLGSVHLSIGEEATAVGAIAALAKEDYIMPTHRGHSQVLAKGADPSRVMAELCGKETGYSRGICGSIHLFDKENNNLGSNGIVGGQFPIAIGAGLAIKYKNLNSCVACFFGDGSTNQGWFYELLNLSSLWKLPIILVCVNNLYGMGTHYNRTSIAKIHDKAKPFKIISKVVDGNDAEEIYTEMSDIVNYVKTESRPALIECFTYRFTGHSAHDNRPYRATKEVNEWRKRDPVKIITDKILKTGIKADKIEEMKDEMRKVIDSAEKFAKESKYPEFNDSMQL